MAIDKLNINQWAEEDRPREKLMAQGPDALTNAELLAILIGSGNTKESAVALMQRILNGCGNNLNALGKMTIRELCEFNGIGPAKAISIVAACELGKRRQLAEAPQRPRLDSATAIYHFMHPKMQDLPTEEFWALLLNQNFQLIKPVRISRGGISEVTVDVRIILKEALLANATVIAVCHNHPSGSLKPSKPDDQITQRLKNSCDIMRLHLLDHIIITDGAYFSYHEKGRL